MTALCPGGGSSQPRASYVGSVAFGAPFLVGLLVNWPAALAATIAGIVGLTVWDTTSMCATDPPAMPTITATDVLVLIAGTDTQAKATSLQKFHDLFQNALWPILCECVSGTASSPPPVPAPPSGILVNPTTGVQPPTVTPCWSYKFFNRRSISYDQGDSFNRNDLYTVSNPPVGSLPTTHNAGLLPSPFPDHFTATLTVHADGTNSLPMFMWPHAENSSGTEVAGITQEATVFVAPGASHTLTGTLSSSVFPVLAGEAIQNHGAFVAGQLPNTYDLELNLFCQPAQNVTQPCCPPDSVSQALVQQVLQLVTLIQRQNAPFAYVTGATHAGLSGAGEFAVQGLLGIKLTPSAIPPSSSIQVGDPDMLWLESWVNWGNADGWSPREFLSHSPQVSLPALAGQYTKFGYSFFPGLVVDAVELLREP